MEGERRRRALAWASASLSALVVSVNLSIMSVAFDSLRRDFPATSLSAIGWVLSIYTIVFGAVLVPAGRLADRIGRRTMFLWGLAIMAVASTLAGVAPAVWLIIAGRIGQGIGAACLVPSTFGLLLDAVPADQRAKVTAFYSVIASVGGILGPIIGALLIERSSWRAAFFIAPILAVAALFTGWKSLPDNRTRLTGPLPDLAGSALMMVSLSGLSLGILQYRRWGVTDARIVIAGLAFAFGGVAFVLRSRTHPVPVLPVALLRLRSLTVANIAAVLYGVSTGALLFGCVFFAREAWGYSIVEASLCLVPLAVASFLASLGTGTLGTRFGERAVGAPSTLLLTIGMLLIAMSIGGEAHFMRDWLPGGSFIGLGMGLSYPLIGSAAVRDAQATDFSVASASNRMSLQIGNAIGIAVAIAIFGDAKSVAVLEPMRQLFFVTAAAALAVGITLLQLGDRAQHRQSG